MVETGNRIYRLTATGARALGSERSVPKWYRAILGLVRAEMTSGEIIAGMSADRRKDVLMWIDQLETLGFVEAVLPVGSDRAAA